MTVLYLNFFLRTRFTWLTIDSVIDEELWSHQNTAQKMKFSVEDFFSKCDQIHLKMWICSHLLKKSLMENFIFCAVYIIYSFSVTKAFLCHITHKNLFETYENCISFKILGIHLSKMCHMHFFDLSLLNSFPAALWRVFFSTILYRVSEPFLLNLLMPLIDD